MPRSATTRPQRKNIEEDIADRILALLDKGELPPWEKNWQDSKYGQPRNAATNKPYRGINIWLTTLTQFTQGYDDPRWVTYRQAQHAGGNVKKGEKATPIVFWKPIEKTNEENPEDTVKYTLLRYYSVFNIAQTENCKLPTLDELAPAITDHNPIEEAEAIYKAMPNPPRMTTYQVSNHPPCYIPSMDLVRIPEMSRYKQIEKWYNTLFHELVHSTGHPKRLDRFKVEKDPKDPHAYGKEELVAGMGAAMLAGHAGIETGLLEYDAAYINHWQTAIRADKSIVLRAASLAQRAVDYITNRNPVIVTKPVPDTVPVTVKHREGGHMPYRLIKANKAGVNTPTIWALVDDNGYTAAHIWKPKGPNQPWRAESPQGQVLSSSAPTKEACVEQSREALQHLVCQTCDAVFSTSMRLKIHSRRIHSHQDPLSQERKE